MRKEKHKRKKRKKEWLTTTTSYICFASFFFFLVAVFASLLVCSKKINWTFATAFFGTDMPSRPLCCFSNSICVPLSLCTFTQTNLPPQHAQDQYAIYDNKMCYAIKRETKKSDKKTISYFPCNTNKTMKYDCIHQIKWQKFKMKTNSPDSSRANEEG